MGDHNQTCPSLRWAGMDDKQIFVRDTRDLRFEIQKNRTSDIEPLFFSPVPRVAYFAGPGNVMRRSV